MSNKTAGDVRKDDGDMRGDPRVARTTQALGHALIALVQERDFDSITVQQILDRAGVSRAAFYSHYRNKQDVLYSSYERLFESLEPMLLHSRQPNRLFPVAEFLEHVANAETLVAALRDAGEFDDLLRLCTEYAVRIIDRRRQDGSTAGTVAREVTNRMLAGALVESLRWWLDSSPRMPSAEVDRRFHVLAAHCIGGMGSAR